MMFQKNATRFLKPQINSVSQKCFPRKISTLRGMEDFLPEECLTKDFIVNTAQEIATLYGFQKVTITAMYAELKEYLDIHPNSRKLRTISKIFGKWIRCSDERNVYFQRSI
jgi:hypothetical protein